MRTSTRVTVAAALACCLALVLTTTAQAQRQPSISQDDLKTWLTYISSDELGGRLVYSEGLGLAGAYIARHLEDFGVKPGGDKGTYFQEVRILGVRTRSNSSVTVTVNGQTRTFKDGEGVTFPRNQGMKQKVSGAAAFAAYGSTFAPLNHDDYKGRSVAGKVVLYLGRSGPPGFTAAHNRLIAARGRLATETQRAVAAIGPGPQAPAAAPAGRQGGAPAAGAPPAGGRGGNNAQAVDFQTSQRLDNVIVPQITAGDEFFEFVFSASGANYAALEASADKQEALPAVALNGVSISVDVNADYDVIQTRITRNVVGVVEGSDARLRDTYVMLGAHYDHIGYEQFAFNERANLIASCPGAKRPAPRAGDIINNGADDDGSGTVTLMALAKAFAQGPRPRRSMMFVWHTNEEGGLNGSRYMADHPSVPLEKVSAQLNIDMVGRNKCDDPAEANSVFLVGSDRISTELHNLNEDANAALPAPLKLNYELNDAADLESIYTRSDHYSYASKGVPIIFFTTGLHPDYHYVTDEIDKILFPKMAKVASLVYGTASRVANLDHAPARDNQGARVGKGRSGRVTVPGTR